MVCEAPCLLVQTFFTQRWQNWVPLPPIYKCSLILINKKILPLTIFQLNFELLSNFVMQRPKKSLLCIRHKNWANINTFPTCKQISFKKVSQKKLFFDCFSPTLGTNPITFFTHLLHLEWWLAQMEERALHNL